ncbi:hypothetical protein SAZ11_07040 [Streptomyces sp. FXJ1.4098]|nr:hypothetical protein [Streptomyces sp. FXJ1.4098]
MNVAAAAAGERHQASWLAGGVLATFAAGALLGAAVYGCRNWPGNLPTHLTWCALAYTAAWLPLCTQPQSAVAVLACAAIPGLAFGGW